MDLTCWGSLSEAIMTGGALNVEVVVVETGAG